MKFLEDRILLLMEEKGITQRKMAKDLSITPTTLNGYLHGKYFAVPDEILRRIADYLQVSVDYLTDRSVLIQYGCGIQNQKEACHLDEYRRLSSSNQDKIDAITRQLLKS